MDEGMTERNGEEPNDPELTSLPNETVDAIIAVPNGIDEEALVNEVSEKTCSEKIKDIDHSEYDHSSAAPESDKEGVSWDLPSVCDPFEHEARTMTNQEAKLTQVEEIPTQEQQQPKEDASVASAIHKDDITSEPQKFHMMDKVDEIAECLNGEKETVNLWRLRQLALSKGGLVHPSIRRRAWPKLVSLRPQQESDLVELSPQEIAVIEQDAERAVWHIAHEVKKLRSKAAGDQSLISHSSNQLKHKNPRSVGSVDDDTSSYTEAHSTEYQNDQDFHCKSPQSPSFSSYSMMTTPLKSLSSPPSMISTPSSLEHDSGTKPRVRWNPSPSRDGLNSPSLKKELMSPEDDETFPEGSGLTPVCEESETDANLNPFSKAQTSNESGKAPMTGILMSKRPPAPNGTSVWSMMLKGYKHQFHPTSDDELPATPIGNSSIVSGGSCTSLGGEDSTTCYTGGGSIVSSNASTTGTGSRTHRQKKRGSRKREKEALLRVIKSILQQPPRDDEEKLYYYRGLQDLTALLLINTESPSLSTLILNQLSTVHLRDALRPDFSALQTTLGVIFWPLLKEVDAELYHHMYSPTHLFCLSWIISWFGHEVMDFDVASRLVDVFLCSHATMPIYLSVAMLSHPLNRFKILESESDPASMDRTLYSLMPSLRRACASTVSPFDVVFSTSNGKKGNKESAAPFKQNEKLMSIFEELIEMALTYMRMSPPQAFVSEAGTSLDGISMLNDPPEWAMACFAPSDWELLQHAKTKREQAVSLCLSPDDAIPIKVMDSSGPSVSEQDCDHIAVFSSPVLAHFNPLDFNFVGWDKLSRYKQKKLSKEYSLAVNALGLSTGIKSKRRQHFFLSFVIALLILSTGGTYCVLLNVGNNMKLMEEMSQHLKCIFNANAPQPPIVSLSVPKRRATRSLKRLNTRKNVAKKVNRSGKDAEPKIPSKQPKKKVKAAESVVDTKTPVPTFQTISAEWVAVTKTPVAPVYSKYYKENQDTTTNEKVPKGFGAVVMAKIQRFEMRREGVGSHMKHALGENFEMLFE